jgi:hypothetical protein
MDQGSDRRRRLLRVTFLVVVPLLFLQLPLRRITESYPAIVLPAGASLLRSHGSYTAFEHEYFAADPAGQWHAFSDAALLDTIPAGYRSYVLERGFGITEDRDVRRVSLLLGDRRVQLEFGRPLTPAQIEATRDWLRAKLRRMLGIDAVRIQIRTYALTTLDAEGALPEWRLHEQKTIELLRAGA